MPRQLHYNAAESIPAETAADPYLRPAFSFGNRMRRLVWNLCWAIFFRFSPRPFFAWRAMLLRLFGAKMGPHCHFYPSSRVWAPWNLICADQVSAGDGAEIYNPAPVRLGSHAILSQNSYLCGATHDFDDRSVSAAGLHHGSGTVCVGMCAGVCRARSQHRRRRGTRPRLRGDTRPGAVGRLRRIASRKSKTAQPAHPLSSAPKTTKPPARRAGSNAIT